MDVAAHLYAVNFQSVERLGRQKTEVYEAEVSTVEGVTWRVRKRANEWAMLRAAIKQECLEGGGGELSAAYLQLKRPSPPTPMGNLLRRLKA